MGVCCLVCATNVPAMLPASKLIKSSSPILLLFVCCRVETGVPSSAEPLQSEQQPGGGGGERYRGQQNEQQYSHSVPVTASVVHALLRLLPECPEAATTAPAGWQQQQQQRCRAAVCSGPKWTFSLISGL